LVAGFDRLWAVIPPRISKGTAIVEAFEVWKNLSPAPTTSHVGEMVRLLEAYLEEDPKAYAFFDFDGSPKVTPAMLIRFLCRAMNEGSPLSKVVDEAIPW
jgi:hypothetical protein